MQNHKVSYFLAGICLIGLAVGCVFWLPSPDAPVLWKIGSTILISVISLAAANRLDSKEKKLTFLKLACNTLMVCYMVVLFLLFSRLGAGAGTEAAALIETLRHWVQLFWVGSLTMFLSAMSAAAQKQGRKVWILLLCVLIAAAALCYLTYRQYIDQAAYSPVPYLMIAMAVLGIGFLRLSKIESYGHI